MISTTHKTPARYIVNGQDIAPDLDHVAPNDGEHPADEVTEVYPDMVKFKTWGTWIVDVGALPFPVRPGYKIKLMTR